MTVNPDPVPVTRCPFLADAFDLLGRPWTALIVDILAQRPSRFTELHRAIPGISSRLLGVRLHNLTDERLITRHELVRGVVYYRLTDDGRALARALEELRIWSKGRSTRKPI